MNYSNLEKAPFFFSFLIFPLPKQASVILRNNKIKLWFLKQKFGGFLHIKPYDGNIYDHIQCATALL